MLCVVITSTCGPRPHALRGRLHTLFCASRASCECVVRTLLSSVDSPAQHGVDLVSIDKGGL